MPKKKAEPKKITHKDYKKHKGKHAQLIRAHDAKPTMFAYRIKGNFFPENGDELKNSDVARRLHKFMTENDLTFDYDDLTIDVKNDTDLDWNEPWDGERSEDD